MKVYAIFEDDFFYVKSHVISVFFFCTKTTRKKYRLILIKKYLEKILFASLSSRVFVYILIYRLQMIVRNDKISYLILKA